MSNVSSALDRLYKTCLQLDLALVNFCEQELTAQKETFEFNKKVKSDPNLEEELIRDYESQEEEPFPPVCLDWDEIVSFSQNLYKIISESPSLPPKLVVNVRRLADKIIKLAQQAKINGDYMSSIPGEELFSTRLKKESEQCIRKIEEEYQSIDHNYKSSDELRFSFPKGIFHDDVTNIINLTYNEVVTDFDSECYLSAISLCGKIIETVLGALYQKLFGINPEEEKLGIDAITNRLRKVKNYDFKGTIIGNQLSIINAHRNKAIHGSILIPTADEAKAVVLFTRDVLQKVYSKELAK